MRLKFFKFILTLLLLSASSNGLFAQSETGKAAKEGDLARVVIYPFTNATGSENYAYLSSTLVDAISKAMGKKFVFERVGITPVKQLHDYEKTVLTDGDIKKASNLLNADIAIYGVYTYDEQEDKIVFTVNVYFTKIGEKKVLTPIKNPIDSSLFGAAALVADLIVVEINATISAHEEKLAQNNKNKNNKTEEKEPANEIEDKGKKKLTTAALKTRQQQAQQYWGVHLLIGTSTSFQPVNGEQYNGVELFNYGEKYYTNWLSTYGYLGAGFMEINNIYSIFYVRIPIFSPLVPIAGLMSAILRTPMPPLGAFPFIDGFAIHFKKPDANSWFSLAGGAAFGIGVARYQDTTNITNPSSVGGYFALELSLRYHINKKSMVYINPSVGYPYGFGVDFGVTFLK